MTVDKSQKHHFQNLSYVVFSRRHSGFILFYLSHVKIKLLWILYDSMKFECSLLYRGSDRGDLAVIFEYLNPRHGTLS